MCVAVFASACGAELADNAAVDASIDSRRVDIVIDAPPADAPIDARPCTGGQARATDANGTCFVFFTGPLTYADAKAACMANNSQLAIIKSAQTNQVVTSLLGVADAFVGATDEVTEMSFVWGDSTGLTLYSNWRMGEPNNGGVGSTIEEDCMIVEGELMGSWDDRPCAPPPVGAGAYAYVCQY